MTTEKTSPVGCASATGLKERVTLTNFSKPTESAERVNGVPGEFPPKVSALDVAKVILPDIFALSEAMQWPIEGPGLNFAWFRGNDQTPSLNIRDDGAVYFDFVVGTGGGAIDLLGAVENLDRKQACRRFIAVAALVQSRMSHDEIRRCYDEAANPPPQEVRNARATCEAVRREAEQAERRSFWTRLAPMTALTESELQQIIVVRRWPQEAIIGLQRAAELGILLRCGSRPEPCYVVTDAARLSAKERRLDGNEVRPGAKSTCLPGSLSRWPLGTAAVATGDQVILVEGETDQMAMIALVAMFAQGALADTKVISLAAGTNIHNDAIQILKERGRHVTAIGDADDAGRAAIVRWTALLTMAGIPNASATIEGVVPDAGDVSDLLSALEKEPEHSAKLAAWVESLICPTTGNRTS
jgi:hypothetical protein